VSTPLEIVAGVSVEVILSAMALGLLYRIWGGVFRVPKKHTIFPFQRGVLLNGEDVEKVLRPGSHWIRPKQTLVICDMRPKPFQAAGLEMLAADGMGMRISLGGEYQIDDPTSFVTHSSDAFGAFYVEVRQTLYVVVREQSSNVLVNTQDRLVSRVRELLLPRGKQLGIQMTQLDLWEVVPLGWIRQPPELDSAMPPIQ